MAELTPNYQLSYFYGGDRVKDWGHGYIENQKQLFQILNALRTNQEVTGVAPEAYEIKIEDDKLFIRNKTNDAWLKVLDVAENGGLKSNNIGKMLAGAESALPSTSKNYDTYMSLDNGNFYYWINGQWHLLLSLDVTKLNGYDNLVKKDEDTIVPTDTLKVIKEPQKIIRTNDDGVLPVDVSGNAGQIGGKNIDVSSGVQDGQVLTYRITNNTWVPENKSTAGAGKSLSLQYGGETLANYNGGATVSVNLQEVAPNILRRNRPYTVGDIAYSAKLPSYEYLECTQTGITASKEPSLKVQPQATINDGGCTWVVRDNRLFAMLNTVYPVGSIKITTKDEVPFANVGFGTWQKIAAGRTLIGEGEADSGTSYKNGATGGEEKHALSTDENGAHSHWLNLNTSWNGNHHHGAPFNEHDRAPFGVYDGNQNHFGSSRSDWDNQIWNTTTDGNHQHNVQGNTNNSGKGQAHNNMQPYLVVCIWERTA